MEDLTTLEKRAIDAFAAGEYKKSRDTSYELIRLSPNDTRYFVHLAECHQRLGEFRLAENCRARARALSPAGGVPVPPLMAPPQSVLPPQQDVHAPVAAVSFSGGRARGVNWLSIAMHPQKNAAWMVASAILAVALIVLGLFYWRGANKLVDANAHILSLETRLADEKANVASLKVQLAAANATVADLTAQLATANSKVTTLTANLATAKRKVTSLTADLAAANAKVASTQASLDKAYADLAASNACLKQVQDPRHFNTMAELQDWLAKDDTNTNPLYASSSPDVKAFILQVKALRDGYLLPACLDWDASYIYSWNAAVVGEVVVSVNAATDAVTEGPTFGSPPPSHPLPLP